MCWCCLHCINVSITCPTACSWAEHVTIKIASVMCMRSGMFLIYCRTTKTSRVTPVDNRDMAWNHLTQANGLGSIHLKTDRHYNPHGVIHHPAATCGTAHCSNTMYHTTKSISAVSIWCSVLGWRGSLSISVVMPVHWTVHKWHYLFREAYKSQTSLKSVHCMQHWRSVLLTLRSAGLISWHTKFVGMTI
jgi:hypothetical protein